jgi:hypothetical protein
MVLALTIPIYTVDTDNIEREIWRHLKLFTYEAFTNECVKDETAKKQIIACIEQAAEIYSISKSISFVTRPILLCFGMQRLAKALIFLKNPTLGLEKLRHHGLSGSGISDSVESFVNSKVHIQKGGIFPEFSKLTTKNVVQIKRTVYKGDDTHSTETILQESDMSEFLTSKEFELADLFSLVPELWSVSYYLGFKKKSLARCYYSIRGHSDGKFDTLFTIAKDFDLDYLKSSTKIIEVFKNCKEEASKFVLTSARADKALLAESMVESDSGQLFLVCPEKPCVKISDINVHYLLMFLLNYVARYKAPLLKEVIEGKKTTVAALIEKFIETPQIKFPKLVLDQLNSCYFAFK